MVQTYLIHHFYSIYYVGNEHCSFRYLQIIFISSYTFYIENTIYRDNPSVLHLQNISHCISSQSQIKIWMLTYPFTQGRLANMYKFRVTTQDKITTNFWLTVVGANIVRPFNSKMFYTILSYVETRNYNLLHRAKYLYKGQFVTGHQ